MLIYVVHTKWKGDSDEVVTIPVAIYVLCSKRMPGDFNPFLTGLLSFNKHVRKGRELLDRNSPIHNSDWLKSQLE
jgi:hypothetical protein